MKINKKIIKELSDYLDEFNLTEIEKKKKDTKIKVSKNNVSIINQSDTTTQNQTYSNKIPNANNKNESAYFEITISLNISERIKEVIKKIFISNKNTYLNELEFKNLRLLEGNRPTKKIDNTAFMTCKKAVNTWDLDYSQMGSSQFKVGCVSDAATHLFTYCGADYNWRYKYNIC